MYDESYQDMVSVEMSYTMTLKSQNVHIQAYHLDTVAGVKNNSIE